MRTTLISTVSALSLTIGTSTWADITAEDVLRNQDAYMTGYGAAHSYDLSQTDNVLAVSNDVTTFTLPFDLGTISISSPNYELHEADGMVSYQIPERMNYTIQGQIGDFSDFGMVLSMQFDNFSLIASGQPGAITYHYSSDGTAFALTDLVIPELPTTSFDFMMVMSDYESTMTITESDLVEIEHEFSVSSSHIEYSYGVDSGISQTEYVADHEAMTMASNASLPATGIDYSNIAKALRNGLSFSATSDQGEAVTRNSIHIGDQVYMDQHTALTSGSSQMSFDIDGLKTYVQANELTFTVILESATPFPISGAMESMEIALDLPVSARPEPQDFRLLYGFDGITIAEDLWQLFDPAAALPRDPATIRVDVSGTVVSEIDLFDFNALMLLDPDMGLPVELRSLDISDLNISAAGASLIGAASATFDNSDMETFDGFPRPEGMGSFIISGANGLIDTLIEMGLVQPEEAMGARMGMSMMGRATGDDEITSDVEINAEGHLIVNGQRMR